MRLYERAALIAEEEHLTLHLSEPNFTRWQRFVRQIKLTYLIIKGWR